MVVDTVEFNCGVLQECQKGKLKNPHISDTAFVPKLIGDYLFNNIVTFKGFCLKEDSVSFLHKNIVNLYISYELDTWWKVLNTAFTLGNNFFGAIKQTNSVDPDK